MFAFTTSAMLRRMRFFALALFLLTACDEAPAPSAPPAPAPAPEAPAVEEEAPPPVEDEVVAPSYSEAELDAMEAPELESACFQGSTAACDRLGH
ncbi:MAG: hypothetical protein H6724_19220 [Sandaracinus sp.]|nr:hypothetical protein [Sandaracinus sp.]MCB9621573.1 hypothetical protein [Sandaracinus sp.]